jgi:hypothetical protein
VLTLLIPKSEEAMPRKVQIREGATPPPAPQKGQNTPKF